jgi:hypothetical protein
VEQFWSRIRSHQTALVTPDEIKDPDDLAISASLNGEVVQQPSTKDMIFPVAELVARLSAIRLRARSRSRSAFAALRVPATAFSGWSSARLGPRR